MLENHLLGGGPRNALIARTVFSPRSFENGQQPIGDKVSKAYSQEHRRNNPEGHIVPPRGPPSVLLRDPLLYPNTYLDPILIFFHRRPLILLQGGSRSRRRSRDRHRGGWCTAASGSQSRPSWAAPRKQRLHCPCRSLRTMGRGPSSAR